ncbi:zinc ribbon domain-containing protein YjdM [Conchiformibius kuhniae]|uniref:Zinc ribbon domain-containing protein YjdM n=1 Tax=Conchiformibius kuhniae TaxID=211502 RepID=A0A8T9MYX7_9NEIS|nr:zinc ribbon domain-containing protein YjdM [Conchiformibius kuhniae]UOP05688.1 alkylphosphonate utilization protein [Conchiformibius kuhniae]
MSYPPCPQCASALSYHDGTQWVCPECAHEWQPQDGAAESAAAPSVCDAHGTPLQDGDAVVLVKDLKIKGSSAVIKQGTKVKNIRLQDGDHNISCKINGTGMNLKSEFVKKA